MRHGYCINCGRLRELTRTLECRTCCGERVNAEAKAARSEGEPTEAELDELIAQQRPTMPGPDPMPERAYRGVKPAPGRHRKETKS